MSRRYVLVAVPMDLFDRVINLIEDEPEEVTFTAPGTSVGPWQAKPERKKAKSEVVPKVEEIPLEEPTKGYATAGGIRVPNEMKEGTWRELRRKGNRTTGQVAKAMGLSRNYIQAAFQVLLREDRVTREKVGRSYVYRIVSPGADAPDYKPRKVKPPELEAVENAPPIRRGLSVAGTGNGDKFKGADKEIRRLIRRAISRGWTAEIAGGGHIKATSPEGKMVTIPATPSDHRSIRNVRADLRNAGLSV